MPVTLTLGSPDAGKTAAAVDRPCGAVFADELLRRVTRRAIERVPALEGALPAEALDGLHGGPHASRRDAHGRTAGGRRILPRSEKERGRIGGARSQAPAPQGAVTGGCDARTVFGHSGLQLRSPRSGSRPCADVTAMGARQ